MSVFAFRRKRHLGLKRTNPLPRVPTPEISLGVLAQRGNRRGRQEDSFEGPAVEPEQAGAARADPEISLAILDKHDHGVRAAEPREIGDDLARSVFPIVKELSPARDPHTAVARRADADIVAIAAGNFWKRPLSKNAQPSEVASQIVPSREAVTTGNLPGPTPSAGENP